MVIAADHGIICSAVDERRLVDNINAFLAANDFLPLMKQKPTHFQPPERQFQSAHVYMQFLKQHPRWYFDLKPNVDEAGRARFPDDLDCGWTLYTRTPFPPHNSPEDDVALEAFFAALRGGAGFPTRLLHSYENPAQDRL